MQVDKTPNQEIVNVNINHIYDNLVWIDKHYHAARQPEQDLDNDYQQQQKKKDTNGTHSTLYLVNLKATQLSCKSLNIQHQSFSPNI